MAKNSEVVEVVDVVELSAEDKQFSDDYGIKPEVIIEFSMDRIKAEIEKLSGKDKLALFNWLKGSGGNGKSATVKNVGVGDFVREKIFEGLSNNEIVESCKEKYGNEQTSYNCVVWYRNKMKKEGLV